MKAPMSRAQSRRPYTFIFALLAASMALQAQEARLSNLSTRAMVGTGSDLIAGFVIGAGSSRQVVIRAVGPSLSTFGLTDFLPDPILTLRDAAGTIIAANDNWTASDAPAMASVGAFTLSSGSRDSAIVTTLTPGAYTAQVTSSGSGSGVVLAEVYELGANGPRMINLSTRAPVGGGSSTLIAGLVVSPGEGRRRVLIRAAGPALSAFGVVGPLSNPSIVLTSASGETMAGNDNWETPSNGGASASEIAAASTGAGAFAFAAGSRDAALLAELGAGAYTVQVSDVNGATGAALVEVYDLGAASGNSSTTPVTEVESVATAGNGEKIPYPTAFGTYTATDSGTTYLLPSTMVLVPAGSFAYGNGATATTASTTAYAIGKFEVTNAEWKAFLDATGSRSFPSHWSNGTYPAGKGAHPVLYVSLNSAIAYCAWISQRTGWAISIPTAEQWEKAARGPNAYLYPWGNSLDATYSGATGVFTTKCNYNGVVAADFLFNHANEPATYNNRNSPYYGTVTTVGKIAGYATTGQATLFSLSSSGNVNGWVNHDTYTGFIYTDVFSALNDTGGTTTPVGSYAAGKSAYGCYDMAGNVWEWTTTTGTASNGAEAGQIVNEIRGGSWYATGSSCRAIGIGEGRAASGNFNTVGIRLVATPRLQ